MVSDAAEMSKSTSSDTARAGGHPHVNSASPYPSPHHYPLQDQAHPAPPSPYSPAPNNPQPHQYVYNPQYVGGDPTAPNNAEPNDLAQQFNQINLNHSGPSPPAGAPGHPQQPGAPGIPHFAVPPAQYPPTSPHPGRPAAQARPTAAVHHAPPEGYPCGTPAFPSGPQLTPHDQKVRENQKRLVRDVGRRLSTLLSEHLKVQPYFGVLHECPKTGRGMCVEYYESLDTLMKLNYMGVAGHVMEGTTTDLERRIRAVYKGNVKVTIVPPPLTQPTGPARLEECFPTYGAMLEEFYSHAMETETRLAEMRCPSGACNNYAAFVAKLKFPRQHAHATRSQ